MPNSIHRQPSNPVSHQQNGVGQQASAQLSGSATQWQPVDGRGQSNPSHSSRFCAQLSCMFLPSRRSLFSSDAPQADINQNQQTYEIPNKIQEIRDVRAGLHPPMARLEAARRDHPDIVDGLRQTAADYGDRLYAEALDESESVAETLVLLDSKLFHVDVFARQDQQNVDEVQASVDAARQQFSRFDDDPVVQESSRIGNVIQEVTGYIDEVQARSQFSPEGSAPQRRQSLDAVMESIVAELRSQVNASPEAQLAREFEVNNTSIQWSDLPEGVSDFINEGDECPITYKAWGGNDPDQIAEPVCILGQHGVFELEDLLKAFAACPMNPEQQVPFTLDQLVRPLSLEMHR